MSDSNFNINKKILYKKNTKFYIKPVLTESDAISFIKFIDDLSHFCNTEYAVNCFFWSYDQLSNYIYVNNYKYSIENEVFNQFIELIIWLYKKNYTVKGSFYSIFDNIIESIKINNHDNLICHNLLIDNNNNNNNTNCNTLFNAKNKIKKYINKLHKDPTMKKYPNISTKIRETIFEVGYNYQTLKSYNSIKTDENTMLLIKSLQERIEYLENQNKNQKYINNFIIRVFTIFGVITVGSLLYYSINDKKLN